MATGSSSDQPLIRTFEHSVSLPVFEGPLDLLLFLIRKNEIDIYDIPIERITRQYLEILKTMEEQRLEVAGEFFVMAATLMQIKSRLLLPKEERLTGSVDEEDEEADPRWELVQQLIEYRKFKEASGKLGDLIEQAQDTLYRDYFERAEDRPERPLCPTDAVHLWNAFNQVLRRLSEKIVIGQIHDETVTISERMEDLLNELARRSCFRFSEVIQGEAISASYVVATFLALLELTRLNRLTLEQEASFSDIVCTAVEE